MAGFLALAELFVGRHFDCEVIVLCVRRFKLSDRDLVEMMAERGLSLAHTTIMFRSSNAAGTLVDGSGADGRSGSRVTPATAAPSRVIRGPMRDQAPF